MRLYEVMSNLNEEPCGAECYVELIDPDGNSQYLPVWGVHSGNVQCKVDWEIESDE